MKNGQTVAVVSNNNAATDNVYEKLEKYKLDYLCARLGKKENKENFIEKQTGEYPKFSEKLEDKETLESTLINLNQDVSEIFNIQNDIAKLKEKLSEIQVEHKYFNTYEGNSLSDMPRIRKINRVTSDTIMKLKIEYEELQAKSLWLRFKSQFIYGIGDKNFYKKPKKEVLRYYNKIFFIVKEIELDSKIKEKKKRLKFLGINKLELLTSTSIKILNEYLRNKYKEQTKRKVYSLKELYTNSAEFNKEYMPELLEKGDIKNIGIISPYRKQKEQIQKTIQTDKKIDTVHKFQGREEATIIITTVDNEISELVDDPKMLNVAVTRAKKYIRLVVSSNDNNENTNIGDLIRYIQYNNFETIKSKLNQYMIYYINKTDKNVWNI